MTKQIDVLVLEPGQAPCLTKAENELEAFEKIIGAPVDVGCYLRWQKQHKKLILR